MATSVELGHRFPTPLTARVLARLNVRARPAVTAARVSRLEPEQRVSVDRWVPGDLVLGNDRWLKLADRDHYIWSGATSLLEPPPPAPAAGGVLAVERRPNGTIRPLDVHGLAAVFGDLRARPAAKAGAVLPDPEWVQASLVGLQHPVLEQAGVSGVRVHRLAHGPFTAVFDALVGAGLAPAILTCGGTYVPRHIGWDRQRPLSSHSWGVAIDFNERWNGYGREPALPGETGCLRELVPLFAASGFAWGGHFSTPDGMHFELALTRV